MSISPLLAKSDVKQQQLPFSIDIYSKLTDQAVNAATELLRQSSKSAKTPVSLLQEICTKLKIQPPVFDFIVTDGLLTHEPQFNCRITIGDIVQNDTGLTKKQAKHKAALAALNELKNRSVGKNDQLAQKLDFLMYTLKELNMESSLSTNGIAAKHAAATTTDLNNDDDAKSAVTQFTSDTWEFEQSVNPVGELLELTTKLSLRPPEFAFVDEEGPPHERVFTCHATFGEVKEVGRGRAKKIAKRHAAFRLLKMLNSTTHVIEMAAAKKLENKVFVAGGELCTVSAKDKVPSSSSAATRKANSDSFAALKTSVNKTVRELLDNRLPLSSVENTVSFIDMFKQLCLEENFSFKFWEVPSVKEGAYSIRLDVCRFISLTILQNSLKLGMNRVILQLRTNPITVFIGTGNGLDASMQQASCLALEYIQILCSR